ncbi:MAG: hypothetical protein RJB36_583, partial [Bacteroidota bacterium]
MKSLLNNKEMKDTHMKIKDKGYIPNKS